MVRSNIEFRGLDSGEVGTEDGAKSDGCSERKDQRLDGPEAVETESRFVCERNACWNLQELPGGVNGVRSGGARTPWAMTWRFFLGRRGSALLATW